MQNHYQRARANIYQTGINKLTLDAILRAASIKSESTNEALICELFKRQVRTENYTLETYLKCCTQNVPALFSSHPLAALKDVKIPTFQHSAMDSSTEDPDLLVVSPGELHSRIATNTPDNVLAIIDPVHSLYNLCHSLPSTSSLSNNTLWYVSSYSGSTKLHVDTVDSELIGYIGSRIFVCADYEEARLARITEVENADEERNFTLEQFLKMKSFRWMEIKSGLVGYIPANYIHATSNLHQQFSVVAGFFLVTVETLPHLMKHWQQHPDTRITEKKDAASFCAIVKQTLQQLEPDASKRICSPLTVNEFCKRLCEIACILAEKID